MSESNSTSLPGVPAEPQNTVSQTEQQPSAQRKPDNTALVLSLVAICFSVGFAATAFFIWQQLQQLTGQQAGIGGQVDERMQPIQASIQQLTRAVENSDEKMERRFRVVEQRSDKFEQEQRSLDHRVSVLGTLIGRSEQGWSLAEVEYLLGIANQRLQLQRDVKTAVVALQNADARLQELADPHYLNVREQIAKDLETLANVPVIDVDGIALQLSAWSGRIDELPVTGTRYQPVDTSDSADHGGLTTAEDWKQLPRLVWQSLQQLFQLREHDEPVKPMLAPEREYFLRENLRLQLAAAKLALLRNDNGQYQASLRVSQEWLEGYFASDDEAINTLHNKLGELLKIDIRPELPNISGSLRLLRQQMKLSTPEVPAQIRPTNPESPASQSGSADAVAGEEAEL